MSEAEGVTDTTQRRPVVWSIGGGKGGVGKSVIAANLGVELARRGNRVALVDGDLGGANLHTLLGLPFPSLNLADFVSRRAGTLDEIMIDTRFPGLSLVSGSQALLEMANPKHFQKEKILRHVRALPVDTVVLDLGAGSAFNVLDFFLAADLGVLVVAPEATSVENAYHFLKAAFYRKLKRARPRDRVRNAIAAVSGSEGARGIRTPRNLIELVARYDHVAGAALVEESRGFRPGVLVNRVGETGRRDLSGEIATASREYFGTDVIALGGLPVDPAVPRSVEARRPVVATEPAAEFSAAIRAVLERIGAGP